MLYGIEGILNGKLFGNGEGGSSGGGLTLPELTNPAGADQILEGFEAIDGSGNKLTGTHVCESGGGGYETVKLPFSGKTLSAGAGMAVGLDAYNPSESPTGYTECSGFIPGTPIAGYVAYDSRGGCWAIYADNCSTVDAEIPDGEADFVITHVTTP